VFSVLVEVMPGEPGLEVVEIANRAHGSPSRVAIVLARLPVGIVAEIESA
jgi:hypothetical protein